ncbi:hypothetical protein [Escherichia coli]|uniref:hypothetical protein n=1 Tax=Escherichia coli TaxID=562 RepID=UPI001BD39935|nr:hypothetical protein [Escherichia coli]MBS9579920.1 hypothetical protein [Escherichia coli]
MVINYRQLREKREQVKKRFRRNEDLTPLICLAQGIIDAYEISLELPSQTWTDTDGNRQHYVSCGLEANEGFRRMPLSQIPAATPGNSNDERKLTFGIETVVDDTPGEVAFVHTLLSITMCNDEIQVRVNNNIVPLKEGSSPYATVCEAIQYHVLSEIDNLRPDGTRKMVQLW